MSKLTPRQRTGWVIVVLWVVCGLLLLSLRNQRQVVPEAGNLLQFCVYKTPEGFESTAGHDRRPGAVASAMVFEKVDSGPSLPWVLNFCCWYESRTFEIHPVVDSRFAPPAKTEMMEALTNFDGDAASDHARVASVAASGRSDAFRWLAGNLALAGLYHLWQMSGVAAIVIGLIAARRRLRRGSGRCADCGYASGGELQVCPECGAPA